MRCWHRPGGGSAAQALPLALADPPYQTRTDDVKVRWHGSGKPAARLSASRLTSLTARAPHRRAQNASFDVVCKVLLAVKDAEMGGAVDALTLEECDVLMKYLYRGLGPAGKKNDVYGVLLKWHPLLLKRAGVGSIMRAISEVNQAL